MALLLLLFLVQAAPSATAPGASIDAAEADRLFALAATLYDEDDPAAAAATYASLLDAGVTSGALHHNLGMAYLGAGDLGRATLHLQKAERLLSDDEAVATHLAEARAQIEGADEGAIPVVPASPVAATAVRIADAVSLGALLALGLLLWAGALAVLGWRLWRRDTLSKARKTLVRRSLVAALPLAALLLATAALASAERHAPRAVVLDATPLAATPGGPQDGVALAEGLTVRLRLRLDDAATRGTWQAVRLADGTEGWLPASALGQL